MMQTPPLHTAPVWQADPHPPQFCRSSRTSRQEPSQQMLRPPSESRQREPVGHAPPSVICPPLELPVEVPLPPLEGPPLLEPPLWPVLLPPLPGRPADVPLDPVMAVELLPWQPAISPVHVAAISAATLHQR